MAKEPKIVIPKELASAVNLMAHPLAGAAAFSAIGIGMASHAFGLWLGAVEAAAQASQRMLKQANTLPPVMARLEPAAAASKAQAATKVLMQEAQSFARDVQAEAEVKLAPAKVAPQKPAPLQLVAAAPAKVLDMPAAPPGPGFVQPKALKKPAKADDLKAISGVGPKLEQVLNGLGVWTYAQIAAWTPQESGWVDEYLSFSGRIVRDDWTGQAKALAGKKTKT